MEDAPGVPVGVREDGEMEIPAVDQVGYRFGARPGDDGAAVLAAHVAYDGVDGVFRRLADVSEGDDVRVRFADGTEQAFAVTAVARYPKSDLLADVWRRAGDPELVLIHLRRRARPRCPQLRGQRGGPRDACLGRAGAG